MIERVKEDICEILRVASEEKREAPSDRAVMACYRIATLLEVYIPSSPEIKCAVFEEAEQELSVVIQSLETDRRVNFKISKDGKINVLTIDENMAASTSPIAANTDIVIWAKWVINVG